MPDTLHLTEDQIGASVSAYLVGAVAGALVFGRLTDKLGRKKLFFVTLAVYLVASFLTAFSTGFISFAIFRALTGAGIGGEYSAINAAIDELLPARVRGRADLAINGTYWLGAALGSLGTLVLLDPAHPPAMARLARLLRARRGPRPRHPLHPPASPREPALAPDARSRRRGRARGRRDRGARSASRIRAQDDRSSTVRRRHELAAHPPVLFVEHRRRAVLGLVLMVAQAFAYNGVFFTYALVLGRFYGVPPDEHRSLPPSVLVRESARPDHARPALRHRVGRRTMIATTYASPASCSPSPAGRSRARRRFERSSRDLWCVVFFVASAAASSAYLTVSELFPVELRGMAIAIFYAVGTGAGGVVAPALFGALVGTGSRDGVLDGYLARRGLMVVAGARRALARGARRTAVARGDRGDEGRLASFGSLLLRRFRRRRGLARDDGQEPSRAPQIIETAQAIDLEEPAHAWRQRPTPIDRPGHEQWTIRLPSLAWRLTS